MICSEHGFISNCWHAIETQEKIDILDEHVGVQEPVRDFARSVYERFAKKHEDQQQLPSRQRELRFP